MNKQVFLIAMILIVATVVCLAVDYSVGVTDALKQLPMWARYAHTITTIVYGGIWALMTLKMLKHI